MNRPFLSTNTNFYDETCLTATPTNLNGQSVMISQEQQRRMFDTLNTSIAAYPSNNPQVMSYFYPGNFLQAQREFQPDGVLFSFPSQYQISTPTYPFNQPVQQQMPSQNVCCCGVQPNLYENVSTSYQPQSIQQQIAMAEMMKQMEIRQYQQQQLAALENAKNYGLETMDYQQMLSRNPFQLNFHKDIGTSSADLNICPTSHINNCCCAIGFQRIQMSVDPRRDNKKLILSQPPQPSTRHVSDVLDKDATSKKNVSFLENDPNKKCQPHCESVPAENVNEEKVTGNCCEQKRSLVMQQQTEPLKTAEKAEQTNLDYCQCTNKGNSAKKRRNQRKIKPPETDSETEVISSSSSSEEVTYEYTRPKK